MRRELRHTLTFPVQFDETDMLGVVHNSVYFKWFERGRMGLLQQILPVDEVMATGVATPVVRNTCDYQRPARFGDTLVLVTRMPVDDAYSGKLRFVHELSDSRTRQPVARGEAILTLMNYRTHRLLKTVPEPIMARLSALLDRETGGS